MKQLYLVIIGMMVRVAFAQVPVSLSGRVTDQSTGVALPYATIQLVGTSIGTTTNGSGEFVFRIPPATQRPIILVSYLGYQSVQIKPEDKAGHRLTVALQPTSVNLDEVTVRRTDPWPILQQSIDKFFRNYASDAYMAEGFQRESVTSQGKVIQLLEVAYRTQGTSTLQASRVLDARYLEDKQEKAPLWNPGRGGFYTFGWTSVSGIDAPSQQAFLGVALQQPRDLIKYYEFSYRGTIRQDGKAVHVIDFDQKKSVRKALLKGSLYIDAESDAILKIEHAVSPHGLSFLKPHQTWGGQPISKAPKRITIQQDRWVTTYKQYGSRWYLNSVVIDTDFTAALVFLGLVQAQKNALRLHSERIVTAIDTTSAPVMDSVTNIAGVGSLPTLQNFIKQQYERYDETGTGGWAKGNFILSDTATARLAGQLRLNNRRWALATQPRAFGRLSTRQLTEDVDYLQESLVKLHPGLSWYTNRRRFNQGFDSVRSQLATLHHEADLLRLLSPLVEQIHCGHTELFPSRAAQPVDAQSAPLFPLALGISGDSAVVLEDYDGVSRGSTVMSINNYSMADIAGRIRANIPADGYNQTYKSFRLQHEFGRLFDRYIQRADTFAVTIKPPNGPVRTLRLMGQTAKPRIDQPATARVIDSLQSLVLTIPSFATGPDFPAFLEQTFGEIKAKGLKNLVIDLRNNQGGRDEYGALLYAYLTDKPFRYYDRITVATTDSAWLNRLAVSDQPLLRTLPTYVSHVQNQNGRLTYTAHANLGTVQPQANRFSGNVYVLINGGTFSTAAEFAAVVRSNQRALFIGQETGGGYYGNSSLATPILTLPHSKIRLTIPLAKYELAVSPGVAAGHGVQPDHVMTSNLSTILSSQDQELKMCFDLVKKAR